MDKYTENQKTTYILGISLIVEALLNKPEEVKTVYLSSKAIKNKELAKLTELCNTYNIEVIYDDNIIDKISLKENCYGIGVINKYEMKLKTNKHLVLYGFKDYGELGTIVRSAVSFDFSDIVLIQSPIDIYNPKVIRASMGSFFHSNIKKYNTLNDYLGEYKYNLYPFTGEENRELKSIKIKEPYSIIIPSKYHDLDEKFIESYYISNKTNDVALTSLAAIVFNYFYHQNANDRNI